MGRAFQTKKEGGARAKWEQAWCIHRRGAWPVWPVHRRAGDVLEEVRALGGATPVQGSVGHSEEFGYCSKSHGEALQDLRGVTRPNAFQWHNEDSDHGHDSPQLFVPDQDHRPAPMLGLWGVHIEKGNLAMRRGKALEDGQCSQQWEPLVRRTTR